MKRIIPYLDDIFLLLGIITIVFATYLINAIAGTYVLGVAFLVVAFFTGQALPSIIERIKKGK